MSERTPKDAYRLLAECIRSDQLTSSQIQDEFEADPLFKDWYFKNYILNKVSYGLKKDLPWTFTDDDDSRS